MDQTVSSRYCTPRVRGMGLPCLLALVAPNHPCHAAVTNALFDGNFELQTGNGESQTVSNRFESTRNQTTTTRSALARPMPDSFPPRRATSSIFQIPTATLAITNLSLA